MYQQIYVMLELQERINSRVNPDWKDRSFEWYRAIWVECAELLDHYGWKWWKKQTPDLQQVHLELIDIWHFGLSILLQSGKPLEQIAREVAEELEMAVDGQDFRLDLEDFAATTLQTRGFSIPAFARLMAGVGMNFDDLYRGYVGKNVLNFFRQDHGYQEGTYLKVWAGLEDNEHLVQVTRELDAGGDDYADRLYGALKQRYESQQLV